MTMFECIKSFISGNAPLAAKVTGGFFPGPIPQKRADGVVIGTMRYISGASQPPTHDGGSSPWSQVRIELTFWGNDYKTSEQCALMAGKLFGAFNGYLGGTSNGRFCCNSTQGPRDVYDPQTRLVGVQIDILGLLNGDTLS